METPNDRWGKLKPTLYENWPQELKDASMRTRVVELDDADRYSIRQFAGMDVPIDNGKYQQLRSKIIIALGEFPDGAFVKLSSRSPKDSYQSITHGTKCLRELQVFASFTDSERTLEDTHLPVNLLLREWVDIPKSCEFRCFHRDGKLIGISQYFYDEAFKTDWEWAAGEIVAMHRRLAPHLPDRVVFDVALGHPLIKSQHLLIELNPYGPLTDPCLFTWAELTDVFDPRLKYNVLQSTYIPLEGH